MRTRQAASREPSPSGSAEANELADRLRAAVGQLPRRQAEVFCLTCFEQMTSEEIAERLEISPTATRMLLCRARAASGTAPGTFRQRPEEARGHEDGKPRRLPSRRLADLERAVDAVLRDPIPGPLPPERVARLAAVVRQAADQPYPLTIIERIKNMRSRTRIAVAAAVVLAFFGLMSWLVPGGGPAVAFADIVEALNNVHSATWKMTTVTKLNAAGEKKEETFTTTTELNCMFLAPCYERSETTEKGGNAIAIVDGQKDKMISLDPAKKTATITDFKNVRLHGQGGPGRTFLSLREYVAKVQSGKAAGEVDRLGPKTIDGRSAEGFRVQTGTQESTIWADPKTLLPIRVEETNKLANGGEMRVVLSDFQINPDLDKSLFSFDVPSGYKVRTAQRTNTREFGPLWPMR